MTRDAREGVELAELPGSGSRSAVFLIHSEVSGGAGRKIEGLLAGRFVKNRMLSHAEYERPVTRGTRRASQRVSRLAGSGRGMGTL